MESLPRELIISILKRLDVKTLGKMKVVSKLWKSIIENRSFQKRQLMHRRQSRNPDILLIPIWISTEVYPSVVEATRTLIVGSAYCVKIFIPWENRSYNICKTSCEGLICLYKECLTNMVFNPTTRWYREFPYSNYQLLFEKDNYFQPALAKPGFGKDKTNDTYKVVYLYNSSELVPLTKKRKGKGKADLLGGIIVHGPNSVTVCEVFDFTTNAWRYVVPSSPYQVLPLQDPVHFDGSLCWFTEGEITLVLSLDLHTERFQVISEAPFPYRHNRFSTELVMCNLDDRLCVSEKLWPKQMIWSFDSDNKTWTEIYSIDFNMISCWFGVHIWALTPLAIVDKDKLLFCESKTGVPLLTLDPNTESSQSGDPYAFFANPLCYFESLISF